MSFQPDARRRLPVGLLVLVAVALVACTAVNGVAGVREAIGHVIAQVRAAGPAWFFTAMAILPAPVTWFTVPAGEAFADQLTLPGVAAFACLAAAVQIVVWYGLARSLLRPLVCRRLSSRGYQLPEVSRRNAASVVLLVHLVPGPPGYLLALLLGAARVPFAPYFVISWLVTVPWVIGGVVLGRGVLQGNFTLAASGVAVVLAASVAFYLGRRRLAANPAP